MRAPEQGLVGSEGTEQVQPCKSLTLPAVCPPTDAYVGQNTQLRDTINNLVEKQPQTWHTVCARHCLITHAHA